ncbi:MULTISPECIES: hypothetical protein [Sphingomonas]|uniref:hypothetical protein n=1 Tax=Sphingomonas TaxID=13687 RepID=UPI000DEEBF28|nr:MULTISPECIES: hypothetical protein [Sphingomonas]
MAANYRPLMDLADDLAGYQRYCSTADDAAARKIEGQFNGERRKLVYELIGKGGVPVDAVLASVDRDLERIAATGNHTAFAIDHVREQVHQHLAKQLGSSRAMQLLTRWGPPIGAGIALIAYFYLKTLPR